MTTLTPQQIAQVAYAAGFRGTGLVDAVAVALAESSGNPAATHRNTNGSIDRGLWQINSAAHPDVPAATALSASGCAGAAFRISNGGTNWKPWATWPVAAAAQMGRARLAVGGVTPASASSATGGGGGVIDASAVSTVTGQAVDASDLSGIYNFLNSLIPGGFLLPSMNSDGTLSTSGVFSGLEGVAKAVLAGAELAIRGAAWIGNSHNWIRVVEVIGGAAALFIGLKMLADSGIGGPVGGTVAAAGKAAGKVTGAAKTVAKTAGEAALVA